MVGQDKGESGQALAEVRTRRLVVVDEAGDERAVVEVTRGHVELRLVSGRGDDRCEVVAYAGEQEPGLPAAGVELWAGGNSASGWSVVIEDGQIDVERNPES